MRRKKGSRRRNAEWLTLATFAGWGKRLRLYTFAPIVAVALAFAGCAKATGTLPATSTQELRQTASARAPRAFGVILQFDGANGSLPFAGIVGSQAGILYGEASEGGSSTVCTGGCGVVFALTPATNGYTQEVIYSFKGGSDGSNPRGGLTIDKNGTVFGTTSSAIGTIFTLKKTASGYAKKVIYRFNGQSVSGPLFVDSHGIVYGTTGSGGSSDCFGGPSSCGTVFALFPKGSGYTYKLLYAFHGDTDGEGPGAGVTRTQSGDLIGTTLEGGQGSYCCGTIFQLKTTASGYKETILYRFTGKSDGDGPFGPLLAAGGGTYFGTTPRGGLHCSLGGCGTVFELKAGHVTTIYTFKGANDGAYTAPTLTMRGSTIYGSTSGGGSKSCGNPNGCGTIFSLSKANGSAYAKTELYEFTGQGNGAYPEAGVWPTTSGQLVGTAAEAGDPTCDCGVLFQI